FAEKVKIGGEVINLAHVEEVINIMGTPEAISNEEEQSPKSAEKRFYGRARSRRLYRDPEDKVLGGVCGGLGAYFGIDPVIIRILFVLIFFFPIGSSVLIYLILWIVVPKASSTAQRLEMKGEEVNIDNISKSIKEEIQDVKENFRNYRSNPYYSRSRNGMNEVVSVIGTILTTFVKIILIVIGVIFLIIGAIALIALIGVLFASHEILSMTPFVHGFNYTDLFFIHGSSLTWLWAGIALVIGIPLLMLIYAGIRMIFKVRSSNHVFGPAMGGLFIIGIIILAVTASSTLGELRKKGNVSSEFTMTTPSDTLYMTAIPELNDDPSKVSPGHETMVDSEFQFDRFRIGSLNGKDCIVGYPLLKIEKSDGSKVEIEVSKESRGSNYSAAQKNASDIHFETTMKDSLLTLQSNYLVSSVWRNQCVDVTVKIPVGKTILFDKNIRHILYDAESNSDLSYDDMVGKYFTMKQDGLVLVNKALPSEKPVKRSKP
ncbi:MAG: PspC domain-containing protein, partial [Marinilabiliales bacterium]|nr:PspC domain-containing protein [Marinilabiliales bacterium]